ncbi:hypothetical protein AMATHDRAFT_85486 [Amanita thiersii Skay4041]|uniref:Uncharacterized protein n=1 Tax=Amanita thiersii Skay4041 TaxID=703135 RepID=A0A2A9NT39_9AGAR|nr:hypothetical protein AMATHDRAFT_85486 [Amanita thiersii Skay4041]
MGRLSRLSPESHHSAFLFVWIDARSKFWITLVVFVQSSILVLLITFFVVTSTHPLPLPDFLARRVRDHPQTTTLIVTVVASLIAWISSFFFAEAIRFTMNIHLSFSTISLQTMSAFTHISRGDLVFKGFKSGHLYISVLVAIAALLQTAALTAVFTPSVIVLPYPMEGQELDITNPKFVDILGPFQRDWSIEPALQPDTRYTVAPAVLSSGDTSVRAALDMPNFFTFNNYSYIESTCGILPSTLSPIPNALPGTNSSRPFLPTSLMITKTKKYNGLKSNYTMIQQGYTPTVKCRPGDLPMTVTYSVEYARLSANVTCPDDAYAYVYQTVGVSKSAILGFSCPVSTMAYPYANGLPAEYDIFLKGYGELYSYIPGYICRVNSDVTAISVSYSSPSAVYSVSNSTVPNLVTCKTLPQAPVPVPRLGFEATNMFLRQVVNGQNINYNSIGNVISAFYLKRTNEPDFFGTIWESYIKGSLQFASTLMRTNVTSTENPNGFVGNGTIPIPLRHINGTYNVGTIGWIQGQGLAHRVTFLAPLMIITLSLIIIIWGFIRLVSIDKDGKMSYYDPMSMPHFVPSSGKDEVYVLSTERRNYKVSSLGGGRFQVTEHDQSSAGPSNEAKLRPTSSQLEAPVKEYVLL